MRSGGRPPPCSGSGGRRNVAKSCSSNASSTPVVAPFALPYILSVVALTIVPAVAIYRKAERLEGDMKRLEGDMKVVKKTMRKIATKMKVVMDSEG